VEVSIKRRLVGAMVLVVFAIIILPVLFDGDGRVPVSDLPNMPPVIKKPDVSSLRVDLPVEARMPKEQPAEQASDKAEQPEPVSDAPAEATGIDAEGNPRAWSLQIASFKSSENAARLRDELRTMGYRAYHQESQLSDGSLLTQVMVGPEQVYDKILELRSTLQGDLKSLGVNGPPLVVKYQP
jgi:DedD protein